jgi:hypothetical protein
MPPIDQMFTWNVDSITWDEFTPTNAKHVSTVMSNRFASQQDVQDLQDRIDVVVADVDKLKDLSRYMMDGIRSIRTHARDSGHEDGLNAAGQIAEAGKHYSAIAKLFFRGVDIVEPGLGVEMEAAYTETIDIFDTFSNADDLDVDKRFLSRAASGSFDFSDRFRNGVNSYVIVVSLITQILTEVVHTNGDDLISEVVSSLELPSVNDSGGHYHNSVPTYSRFTRDIKVLGPVGSLFGKFADSNLIPDLDVFNTYPVHGYGLFKFPDPMDPNVRTLVYVSTGGFDENSRFAAEGRKNLRTSPPSQLTYKVTTQTFENALGWISDDPFAIPDRQSRHMKTGPINIEYDMLITFLDQMQIQAPKYNLFKYNCNHQIKEVANFVEHGYIPTWLDRHEVLANLAQHYSDYPSYSNYF